MGYRGEKCPRKKKNVQWGPFLNEEAPLRATLRFVQLFGDFGTTDRERTVFLREGGDTSDEDGPARRPTIEAAGEEAGSEPEADEPAGGEPFAAWFSRIHRSR